jgi:hypothetical protein
VIFLGPGSPTYAYQQLHGSVAWHTLVACQRLGASLVMASAATIASGTYTLPVYEIYKAGHDLHWQPGLGLMSAYGLELVLVSHWNNNEGGTELDTSRCFMGEARFAQLQALLPSEIPVVGIDEHTALVLDISNGTCHVMGRGGVTLIRGGEMTPIPHDQSFPITRLGPFSLLEEPRLGIPDEVWGRALDAYKTSPPIAQPPEDVTAWTKEREVARAHCDWALADELRARIEAEGWQVRDTSDGSQLTPS